LITLIESSQFKAFNQINGFINSVFLNPSIDENRLNDTIQKLIGNRFKRIKDAQLPLIVGNAPNVNKLKHMIPSLASSDEGLLISGEIGVGKELFAKTIHCNSNRRDAPFVSIRCSESSFNTLDQELFGNSEGGDDKSNRKGRIKAAHTGTLFLDEISKMPIALQSKLLQIVEEGKIFHLHSNTYSKINVRIIGSTSIDLQGLVDSHQFRKDLFYRLNVLSVHIPPLRGRIEDISLLTDYLTDKHCKELGKSHFRISNEIKGHFTKYNWPTNISGLENIIKTVVVLGSEKNIIDKLNNKPSKQTTNALTNESKDIYALAELSDIRAFIQKMKTMSLKAICNEFIARAEKKLMRKALEQTNWNRKKAAVMLDISYKAMLNKIKAYGLA
jgi:DNA-binding NtrC family response regulator